MQYDPKTTCWDILVASAINAAIVLLMIYFIILRPAEIGW